MKSFQKINKKSNIVLNLIEEPATRRSQFIQKQPKFKTQTKKKKKINLALNFDSLRNQQNEDYKSFKSKNK